MLLTEGVTDSKAAISGVTTLGHEGFNTSSAGGRMIRFDSLQNDGSKIDRLKTMYQRKMVSIETEQGVLKSDSLFLNLEEVEKSILNSGCDIGSIFVKSHHSAVKVAYHKVTKFQPNFGNFGNYGNYGNSAILLFHDFPKVEIIAQIREPLVATKRKLFRWAIIQAWLGR